MRNFNIIAAIDEKRGLGKDNSIPWRIQRDVKWFKTLTTKTREASKRNACIMGRKTWESLPENYQPLPDRLNIVISRQENYSVPEDVILVPSLDAALALLENEELNESIETIFLVGGAELYKEGIDHSCCSEIILTRIWGDFDCDCHFPDFSKDKFKGVYCSNIYVADTNYMFYVYKRKELDG